MLTIKKSITRQSLPDDEYLKLLGSAICVFNRNNAFIIENYPKLPEVTEVTWGQLIDMTSGSLCNKTEDKLTEASGSPELSDLFDELVTMRNRIIHSFRITNKVGEQSLQTKEKDGRKFEITKAFLEDFIKKNQKLSTKLCELRKKTLDTCK